MKTVNKDDRQLLEDFNARVGNQPIPNCIDTFWEEVSMI